MPKECNYRLMYLIVCVVLLGRAFVTENRLVTKAVPLATPDEHGPVTAIVLDSAGNGWFATGNISGTAYLNLMPLVNGRPPYLTHGDPANRDRGISQMVMTAKGDDGWAIGIEDLARKPLLWRLQGGRWGPYPNSLSPVTQLTDITLADDGHDGWIVGRDRKTGSGMLMRMRNGRWTQVTTLADSVIERVAISSDGSKGWGIGANRRSPGTPRIFRLSGGAWAALASNPFPQGQIGKLVTADSLGNGWVISGPPSKRTSPDTLIRLTSDGKARVVRVVAPPTGFNPEPPLVLSALDVNGTGEGWAVGSLFLGIGSKYPGIIERLYQPVPIHLRGGSAFTVPPEAAGLMFNPPYNGEKPNILPTELTVGPDGAQAILGGVGGYDTTGTMYHLHEPWPYPYPPSAQAMPGAGRCFDGKPYCLRGKFARLWEQRGGVERLGFPITPEVQEIVHYRLGGTYKTETITVQYTERARLERVCLQAPCEVMLGVLGRDWQQYRPYDPNTQPSMNPFTSTRDIGKAGWHWFPQTQHNVDGAFFNFWQSNGGLAVYGYPISERFFERQADGKSLEVQYFERNRLEYHPEHKGTRNEIMAGMLGVQVFRSRYGFTP